MLLSLLQSPLIVCDTDEHYEQTNMIFFDGEVAMTKMKRILAVFVISMVVMCGSRDVAYGAEGQAKEFTNSIGMKLIRIEAGSFVMGADSTPLPDELISLAAKRGPSPRARSRSGSTDRNSRGTRVSPEAMWCTAGRIDRWQW